MLALSLLTFTGLFLFPGLFSTTSAQTPLAASFQTDAKPIVKPAVDGLTDDSAEALKQVDLYGVVVKVEDASASPQARQLRAAGENDRLQKVTVKLDAAQMSNLPGKALPQTITVENVLGENPAYNIPLQPGVRVLLNMETNPTNHQRVFYITNRDRTPALIILSTIALLALLLIGGSEVARHGLLVVLVMLGVYKLLFPMILTGQGAIFPLMAMCTAFPVLAALIHSSDEPAKGPRLFHRNQMVLIGGVWGGTAILVFILWVMRMITPLGGFSNEGLAELWYRAPKMDYWALYLSSVLIAFQGLLFYLCRLLTRQRQADPSLDQSPDRLFGARFQIVMRRGRGLLGPLVSSLGLLCLGLFLPLLLQLEGTPTAQFINMESTASLFVFAFAGGLTLILTVPLTALLVAWQGNQKTS